MAKESTIRMALAEIAKAKAEYHEATQTKTSAELSVMASGIKFQSSKLAELLSDGIPLAPDATPAECHISGTRNVGEVPVPTRYTIQSATGFKVSASTHDAALDLWTSRQFDQQPDAPEGK